MSSLFIGNFKFNKKNKNVDTSVYKTAESLNHYDSNQLDITLNTTINLDDQFTQQINNNNNDKNDDFFVPSDHVLSADQIVIEKELGKGEFGIVQQAIWTNDHGERIQVAIKCLSKQRMHNNRSEFLKEAHIMHGIAHPNIVRLYGVVLNNEDHSTDLNSSSLMLVTELAPLRSLLECLKDQSIKSSFTVSLLCDFAYQIANGMQYLERNRLIHRDLFAARNILVFTKNLVKISDFGLSRALGVGKDYYQTNFNESLKLPIAWCAPECINYLKFTSSSDVWSYGVTLWEMFSYGKEPWFRLEGKQILEVIDEPNFQRLEQPDCCPKDYYSILLRCWNHDPLKRPKFSEIINMLPDCKPELVQAVKDSSSNNQLNFVQGDIITVLDKNPTLPGVQQTGTNQTLWKGCLNDGTVDLFNPNLTVSYLGQNLPNCNNGSNTSPTNTQNHHQNSIKLPVFIKSFLEKTNHHNDKSNQKDCSKKKIRPEMISKPQGLSHTGHVGVDGAFFGDVAYLGDKYKMNNDSLDKISLSRNSSDMSDKTPLLNGNSTKETNSFKKDSLKRNTNKLTINTNGIADIHEYHEISEDENGLCSPKFKPLDFGPSLMDAVFKDAKFKELNFGLSNLEKELKNEKKEKTDQKASNTTTLLPAKKKQASLRSISAAEEQSLDSAIAMVKELATKSMFNHFDSKEKYDSLNLLDNCSPVANSPRFSVTSPTKKIFSFKFNQKSNKEQKTFSDQLNNKQTDSIADSIAQETKEAYESLVESGTIKKSNSKSEQIKESKKSSKYPLLSEVGGKIVGRTKSMTSKSISRSSLPKPPPIPSKQQSQTSHLLLAPQQQPCINQNNDQIIDNSLIQHQQQLNNLLAYPPNPLPLPPRTDRTRSLNQLKHHERRHPLILPDIMDGSDIVASLQHAANKLYYDSTNKEEPKQLMSTFKPDFYFKQTMPLHRNVSFNEATKHNTIVEYSSSPTQCMPILPNSIKEREQRCPQIPADMFVGLPVLKEDECRTPNELKNKDVVEFTFDNRNFKIDLSKLREESPKDEIRLMQKVLAHQVQVSSEDCSTALKKVNYDVHKAIKVIQLRETLKQQSIAVDENCDLEMWIEILKNCNWQVRQAISHISSKQDIMQDIMQDGTGTAV